MRGDFTRSTFDPGKRYSGVRLQQGRVQLDADWNEQVDIDAHLRETGVADLVGSCGVPRNGGGFQIAPTADGLDLTVSAGRIYVDGILCELDAPVTWRNQPDLPKSGEVEPGTHFVYLDVWRHHVTALEDPGIRETALGGPDTATRTRTVCQVKLLRVPAKPGSIHCLSDVEEWRLKIAPTEARMRARAQPADPSDEPCVVPAEAGYTRLENQLYRVEIHGGGGIGEAAFKWSRENGSLVTGWTAQRGNELTVDSPGRDRVLGFSEGDWVELIDDDLELRGEPGLLVQITGVEGNVLTVDPDGQAISRADFGRHPKVRRWDGSGLRTVEVPAANDGWIELEDGIEVRFEGTGFQTGDHWLIPARAFLGENAGTIEWPRQGDDWLPKPPDGIEHHYCKLAVVRFTDGAFRDVLDCRLQFPALTELIHAFPAGGDGQEGEPGKLLPCALAVGVTNGRWPVEGARVLFEVTPGQGALFTESARDTAVIVLTSADGIATCFWALPERFPGDVATCLQVTARLVDVEGRAIGTPLFFHGQFRLAGEAREEEGIRVETVSLADRELENDGLVPVDVLARGVTIGCNAFVAQEPFGRLAQLTQFGLVPSKPTCVVTLDLPYPHQGSSDGNFLQIGEPIGFRPTHLAASVEAKGDEIFWVPEKRVATWLAEGLRDVMRREKIPAILAHLVLKGNFIWQRDRPDVFLDGSSFGRPERGRVDVILPSGDGRRGGDFEMWFWLVPGEPPQRPEIRIEAQGALNLIGGVVREATGAGLPGVVVTSSGPGGTRTATTADNGQFRITDLRLGTYALRAQAPDGRTASTTVEVVGLPTPPRPERGIREVPGIGDAFAGRLTQANITTANQVAEMEPARLGQLLGLSEERAKVLVENAKRLVSG